MIIKILLNFILGYVSISVEGFFIERFINTCISKKILLWGMKREKSSLLYSNISIKDFKNIKKIANKMNCRIRIREKKGLPFIFRKYRKRKIFLILTIPIITLIIISSNFIWNIEIRGLENIDDKEFIQTLTEEGLEIGKYKNKINTNEVINNIRLKRNDISWISINLKGTNAIVSVVEAKEKPELIKENEFCNIIAKKKGVITKITAQTGTALKKVGDIVEEGEELIGGYMEGKYTDTRYVHAKGNVEAKVWYTKKKKMNLKSQITRETGNQENKYTLQIHNFKINLYKRLPNFEKCDTINVSRKFRIFSNFYLPIELKKVTYIETKEEPKTYGKEEAQNLLIQELEEEFEKEDIKKENITNKIANVYELDDNSIELELTYEVLEQIGTEDKINFNE